MKVLGLDISTKTGWAVIVDGTLSEYGLIRCSERTPDPLLVPDYEYLDDALDLAMKVHCLVSKHNPNYIYIEQTNAGSFRSAQKQLEFLHCILLSQLRIGWSNAVRYINTSEWRHTLNLNMTKDQKRHNAHRRQDRSAAAEVVNGNKITGVITKKHLAVWYVNQHFGLSLKMKDNDIADAICIGYSGFLKEVHRQPLTALFDNNILSMV